MSIIPEQQPELRRMPTVDGKRSYYTPGGYMQLIAEGLEEEIVKTAKADVERAKALLSQQGVSRHELTMALGYLTQTMALVIDTAECRQERLDSVTCSAMPGVPTETWEYAPCNLPVGHRGEHINDARHEWTD
ncbi:hypothetical protein [Streptomyces olivaceus]|uniref:hypothetical protein n=1 Tax=Streptomyces olivaceus TaxID=47716 RepID=UPI003676CA7D